MTQVYCWRSVAVFCVDDGVVVCASNAEWIVVIKTKIKNFLSIKSVEYLRRFSPAEASDLSSVVTWRSSGRRSSTWRQYSNQRAATSQSPCRSWPEQ
jgi:hypothetical protein